MHEPHTPVPAIPSTRRTAESTGVAMTSRWRQRQTSLCVREFLPASPVFLLLFSPELRIRVERWLSSDFPRELRNRGVLPVSPGVDRRECKYRGHANSLRLCVRRSVCLKCFATSIAAIASFLSGIDPPPPPPTTAVSLSLSANKNLMSHPSIHEGSNLMIKVTHTRRHETAPRVLSSNYSPPSFLISITDFLWRPFFLLYWDWWLLKKDRWKISIRFPHHPFNFFFNINVFFLLL